MTSHKSKAEHSQFGQIPFTKFAHDLRSLSDIFYKEFVINRPSVNIVELDDAFSVDIAAPGLKKEDFEIEIKSGVLTISTKDTDRSEESAGKYRQKEFDYSSFSRTFKVSDLIDESAVVARYDQGILHLHLPKKANTTAQKINVL